MVSQFGIFTLLPFMVATGVSAGQGAELRQPNSHQIHECMKLASTLSSKTWYSYENGGKGITYYQFPELSGPSKKSFLTMTMRSSREYTTQDEVGIYMDEVLEERVRNVAHHNLVPQATKFEALLGHDHKWILEPTQDNGCQLASDSKSYRFPKDATMTLYMSHEAGKLHLELASPSQGWKYFEEYGDMAPAHQPFVYNRDVDWVDSAFRPKTSLRGDQKYQSHAMNLAAVTSGNPMFMAAAGMNYLLQQ